MKKKNNGTQFMAGGEITFFEEGIFLKKDIDIGFFSAKNKVKAFFNTFFIISSIFFSTFFYGQHLFFFFF